MLYLLGHQENNVSITSIGKKEFTISSYRIWKIYRDLIYRVNSSAAIFLSYTEMSIVIL